MFVAPALEKGDSLPFTFIMESAFELKDDSKQYQGKYVAGIIKTLAKSNGTARIGEMWKTSELGWDLFMEKDKVDAFVKTNVG